MEGAQSNPNEQIGRSESPPFSEENREALAKVLGIPWRPTFWREGQQRTKTHGHHVYAVMEDDPATMVALLVVVRGWSKSQQDRFISALHDRILKEHEDEADTMHDSWILYINPRVVAEVALAVSELMAEEEVSV